MSFYVSFSARRRACCLATLAACPLSRAQGAGPRVPVLAYHRLAAQADDTMTTRLVTLDAQLRLIERMRCTVVPLSAWVDWRLGRRDALPQRPVALTADDGHRSQWQHLLPRLRERGWPITLFVYPSAISNAPYAMRWDQLREAQTGGGGVDVESHTYWHPNLVRDRAQVSPAAFEAELQLQLQRSRDVLQWRLDRLVTLLAWPFGLSDETLQTCAAASGYRAAFSLGNRSATRDANRYAVPRHLMVESVGVAGLAARLLQASGSPPS